MSDGLIWIPLSTCVVIDVEYHHKLLFIMEVQSLLFTRGATTVRLKQWMLFASMG
jgi:hypothetical protein